ncbi:hypothetical protein GPECTOR_187g285 [Gonium pectorale]|uniref:Uncharacterized protein n=1 Tax=Gonium pectorale TaxID=33097 RepID=A0A150FX61_GONPE|nr:hypothetical protein GPECTOR_187g285 [Gonium pectorale]|eukprot:KXZ42189.1 hypothetical protein GPECTOR_187g285 [Gonium pectorale]
MPVVPQELKASVEAALDPETTPHEFAVVEKARMAQRLRRTVGLEHLLRWQLKAADLDEEGLKILLGISTTQAGGEQGSAAAVDDNDVNDAKQATNHAAEAGQAGNDHGGQAEEAVNAAGIIGAALCGRTSPTYGAAHGGGVEYGAAPADGPEHGTAHPDFIEYGARPAGGAAYGAADAGGPEYGVPPAGGAAYGAADASGPEPAVQRTVLPLPAARRLTPLSTFLVPASELERVQAVLVSAAAAAGGGPTAACVTA